MTKEGKSQSKLSMGKLNISAIDERPSASTR
jgi:hypothetical protein